MANASADIRVTIQTSLLWGVVGIGLIVLVLLGLWLVVPTVRPAMSEVEAPPAGPAPSRPTRPPRGDRSGGWS